MSNIILSIIVPVFNCSHFTKSAIIDLMKLPDNHEIIIVDNGSTDNTIDVYNNYCGASSRSKYIKLQENFGFSHANNQGYNVARGENILFLNNDIRVRANYENWTEGLIKYCQDGFLVSAQLGLLDKDFNYIREGTNISVNDSLSYLSGWFLGGSKETFDKLIPNNHRCFHPVNEIQDGKALGPWNELFDLYFEDGDISFRAREQNIPMALITVPIFHIGRATGKAFNMLFKYHESRIRFSKEWKDRIRCEAK